MKKRPGWSYKLNILVFLFSIHTVSLSLSLVSSFTSLFFCRTLFLFSCPVSFYFTPSSLFSSPAPLIFSSILCMLLQGRVWPQAALLTQHLFHHSLPLYSLLFPFCLILAPFPLPPSPPHSHLRSLQPSQWISKPPPLRYLPCIGHTVEWSFSATAKIRWCPRLLTPYYWAELAMLQKPTIHIIPTAMGLHFFVYHHCARLACANP